MASNNSYLDAVSTIIFLKISGVYNYIYLKPYECMLLKNPPPVGQEYFVFRNYKKKNQILNNQNTLLTMTIYDGTVVYAINSYE